MTFTAGSLYKLIGEMEVIVLLVDGWFIIG